MWPCSEPRLAPDNGACSECQHLAMAKHYALFLLGRVFNLTTHVYFFQVFVYTFYHFRIFVSVDLENIKINGKKEEELSERLVGYSYRLVTSSAESILEMPLT